MEKEIFSEIISNFTKKSLFPKIGIELEFYLTQNHQQISDQSLIYDFISKLKSNIKDHQINLLDIEKEQGLGQIEVKTLPREDLYFLSQELILVKKIILDFALKNKFEACFEPTPFFHDCSNALQINLTMNNANNSNLFVKNKDEESLILLNSIAGLLELSLKNIEYFTNKKDMLRFDIERNKALFKNKKYTSPVNLSWGYDNRSCAIRIVGKEQNRRLEFRISDANCDVKLALLKFLEMVDFGIENKLVAPEPIYGNAFMIDKKDNLFGVKFF